LTKEYFDTDVTKRSNLYYICKSCKHEYWKVYNDKRKARREVENNKKLLREAEAKQGASCDLCFHVCKCRQRVEIGAWVMCEAPDESDMLRLRLKSPDSLPELVGVIGIMEADHAVA
jgi:hypothetical protein